MKAKRSKKQILARSVQANRIFKRALEAYNNGQQYNAMQTAKYALNVSRRTGEYVRSYICIFLAHLKFDLGQYRYAQLYCKQALDSLEKFHSDYDEDRTYLQTFLRNIEAKLN